MKKIFALILALVMVFSMGAIAFAAEEETYEDGQGASFVIKYTAENGTAPTETFKFTPFECVSVTDAAEGVDETNALIPELDLDLVEGLYVIELASGEDATIDINLPEYESVGIYTYTFSQKVGNVAGVTYYNDDEEQTMKLVVTVIDQDGFIRVAAVHVENGDDDADKIGDDGIENVYDSGMLTVTKTVTGLLGDKTKEFEITVTFDSDDEILSEIGITQYDGVVSVEKDADSFTYTIIMKHGGKVEFDNIPDGTSYTVEEADYTGEDEYDAAEYEYVNDAADEKMIINGGDEDQVDITNNKDGNIDTGIVLDTLPYIVIGAAVVAAAFVMIARKRRVED